jgi:hypothetical protein
MGKMAVRTDRCRFACDDDPSCEFEWIALTRGEYPENTRFKVLMFRSNGGIKRLARDPESRFSLETSGLYPRAPTRGLLA